MNTPVKKSKLTRQDMEQKIHDLESQLIYRCHFASQYVGKADTKRFMGSGVILSLTALGGKEIFEPVLIRDGLSDETIAALKADLARSYEIATLLKPEVKK